MYDLFVLMRCARRTHKFYTRLITTTVSIPTRRQYVQVSECLNVDTVSPQCKPLEHLHTHRENRMIEERTVHIIHLSATDFSPTLPTTTKTVNIFVAFLSSVLVRWFWCAQWCLEIVCCILHIYTQTPCTFNHSHVTIYFPFLFFRMFHLFRDMACNVYARSLEPE